MLMFERAESFGDRIAIHSESDSRTYFQLLEASAAFADRLLGNRRDLEEARIAVLVPPGFDYVAAQWGVWRAGGVFVPLAVSHPPAELAYVLDDTEAEAAIVHPNFANRFQDACASATCCPTVISTARNSGSAVGLASGETTKPQDERVFSLPDIDASRRAMILYTSGTTSRPKGVVTTHANIQAQVQSLVEAWQWTADDHILHVLPLHHIHGIVNALACAMWTGATCEFLTPFDADRVLDRFAQGGLSLFMAVPTIYAKLIAAFQKRDDEQQRAVRTGCRKMRLMVSGSAALPVTTLAKWKEISGHTLLERYGMTEIGMALSNPLQGERVPGHVGSPLPGVEVRRTDEDGKVLDASTAPGEIEVRGPAVFLEYWRRPEATRAAFRDGWFRTGDVAAIEEGVYRILGRTSVDIIKTGGYKVSALEIEEVLRTHSAIDQCAVVGVPDEQWGECVAACVVVSTAEPALELQQLRAWAKERLAPYKVPTRLKIVDELPRNAMGKVQKPKIRELFDAEDRP